MAFLQHSWHRIYHTLSTCFSTLDSIPPLGVDMDGVCVTVIRMRRHHQVWQLNEFACVPVELEKDATNGQTKVLQQLLMSSATKEKQSAHIAAPANYVATTKIHISDHASEVQQGSAAKKALKKAFPDTHQHLYYDYVVQKSEDKSAQQDLLVIAAEKHKMAARIAPIAAAGLAVSVIDVDYYALARGAQLLKGQLSSSVDEQVCALFHIDSDAILLVLLQQARPIYQKKRPFNDAALNQYLRYRLADKQVPSMQADWQQGQTRLVAECAVMLDEWMQAQTQWRVEQIILSGSLALLPKLSVQLQEKTAIATMLAQPFVDVDIDAHIDQAQLRRLAPASLLACGLAMHRLQQG